MTTFKKPYFYRAFWPFPFCLFFFFLFPFLQHKKDKNKKCNFLSFFDIPKILRKHYFGTMWHYLCFQKYPRNTIKMEKTMKKLGLVFNFKLGPILTLKPPNLEPVFNFTASIDIYIYTYIMWWMPPADVAKAGQETNASTNDSYRNANFQFT